MPEKMDAATDRINDSGDIFTFALQSVVVGITALAAAAPVTELAEYHAALTAAVTTIIDTTAALDALRASGDVNRALANATLYLDAFGHVVLAWVWLRQALVAQRALAKATGSDLDFYRGKLNACQYFYRYELPKVAERCALLARFDDTCLATDENWF